MFDHLEEALKSFQDGRQDRVLTATQSMDLEVNEYLGDRLEVIETVERECLDNELPLIKLLQEHIHRVQGLPQVVN